MPVARLDRRVVGLPDVQAIFDNGGDPRAGPVIVLGLRVAFDFVRRGRATPCTAVDKANLASVREGRQSRFATGLATTACARYRRAGN